MPALSDYIDRTRRLLHDANGTFWSDDELTDAINTARNKVALDTACLRSLETVNLSANVETYALPTATTKLDRAKDVLNIVVVWGNQRVPLLWMPFTEFQANLRIWANFSNMPAVWSNFGLPLGVVYIGPVPDQTYVSYWDILYIPTALVDDNTVDELAYPFDDPAPFYAAYVAKYKQQAYGEAAVYEEQYKQKAAWAISSTFTRRMPNPYAYPVRSW